MTTQNFDIVALIDDYIVIVVAAGALVFVGITYLLYKFSVQAQFGDNFPKEKLQVLAHLDTKKKEKKPLQKPAKKKGKNKNGQSTDSTETSDETATTAKVVKPVLPEPVAAAEPVNKQPSPIAERVTPVEAETKNNKKKNKAKKVEPEASKTENVLPQPEEDAVEKREVKVEEASKQQAAAPMKEKNRKKRAAPQAPQENKVITNLDEDKFITRIASINELQPEYLSFITEFINHVHNERFEFGSVRDHVQNLQAKLRDNEKVVQNKDGEIVKLRSELLKTQKAGNESRVRMDGLAEQLQTTQKALYEARQPKPNEELEKLRKEHFDLKARLQAATEHVKEVEKLKAELTEAKKTLSQPSVDPALQGRVKELEEKLAQSEEAVKNANETINNLKNEVQHLRDREQTIAAEVDAMTREVDGITFVRTEKENIAQAPDNSEELNKLKHEIDEIEKEKEMCKGAINKLNHELRKAHNDSLEYKKEKDDMKELLETLKTEKEDLTKKLDIVEKKLADFTQYHNDSTQKIRELENEMNSLELEKNDLKKQLIEERKHNDELEESLGQSNAASTSSGDAEKVKELESQIQTLSVEKQEIAKKLDITEKKLGDFTSHYEGTSSKTTHLEEEIARVTAKKDELYELTMRLGEKVRASEEQAAKVLKEAEEMKAETLKKLATSLSTSLKSANVKISEAVPKTEEEFTKWVQGLPDVLKTVVVEHAPAKVQTPKKERSVSHNDEVEKLREECKRYEKSIDVLVKQLHLIETAYSEREAELKAEINAIEKA